MTIAEVKNRLQTDFSFLLRTIIENNYFAVVGMLEELGYEYVTSQQQAYDIIMRMYNEGYSNEVAYILSNVPFVKGISHPDIEQAIEEIKSETVQTRSLDPATAIADAVGSIFNVIGNSQIANAAGNQSFESSLLNNSSSNALLSAQLQAQKSQERFTYIILGIVGLVLLVLVFFIIKNIG